MGQIRSRDSKVGAGADTNLSSLKSPKVTLVHPIPIQLCMTLPKIHVSGPTCPSKGGEDENLSKFGDLITSS